MSEPVSLQLVAIRDAGMVPALERQHLRIRSSELVRCRHCSARYWLLVECTEAKLDSELMDSIDITEALLLVANKVSAEHQSGHPSSRFDIAYRGEPHKKCDHTHSAKPDKELGSEN